jgi:hypothetical protein
MVDQHSPHGLARGGEEVSSVLELLIAHEPQVGLVNECRGAQRVAWGLVCHVLGRQPAQLVID